MLDLVAIERSLRTLQDALPSVSRRLPNAQSRLTESSVEALLAGYAELDRLDRHHVDLLACGQSGRVLALNRLVLYGEARPSARVHARALENAERHFYESPAGGIGDLVEWYEHHRSLPPLQLAAGLYARMHFAPQLFVEGNHRTGALLASHVLMRAAQPPLVLTPARVEDWFALTPALQHLHRHGPTALFHGRRLQRRLATLIRLQCDPRHLRRTLREASLPNGDVADARGAFR